MSTKLELDKHPWLPPTSIPLHHHADSHNLLIGRERAKETLESLGALTTEGRAVELSARHISSISSLYIKESFVPLLQSEEYRKVRRYGVYIIEASEDVVTTIDHTLTNYWGQGLLYWASDNSVELLGGPKALKEVLNTARVARDFTSKDLEREAGIPNTAANERLKRLWKIGAVSRERFKKPKLEGRSYTYRLAGKDSWS